MTLSLNQEKNQLESLKNSIAQGHLKFQHQTVSIDPVKIDAFLDKIKEGSAPIFVGSTTSADTDASSAVFNLDLFKKSVKEKIEAGVQAANDALNKIKEDNTSITVKFPLSEVKKVEGKKYSERITESQDTAIKEKKAALVLTLGDVKIEGSNRKVVIGDLEELFKLEVDGVATEAIKEGWKKEIEQKLERVNPLLGSDDSTRALPVEKSIKIKHFAEFLDNLAAKCPKLNENPFFESLKACVSKHKTGLCEQGGLNRISVCVRVNAGPYEYLLKILHRSLYQFIQYKENNVITGRELVAVVEVVTPLLEMEKVNELQTWIKTHLIDKKSNSSTPHQFIAILDEAKNGQIGQKQAAEKIIQLAKKSTSNYSLGVTWSRSHIFGCGRAEGYNKLLQGLAGLPSEAQTVEGILAQCESMTKVANNTFVHADSAAGLVPTFFSGAIERVKSVFNSSSEGNTNSI